MRKKKLMLVLVLMLLNAGCSSVEYREKEIEGYNKVVETTKENYEEGKKKSKEERERVIEDIVKDGEISKKYIKDRLSEEEKEQFEVIQEVRSAYYTALGGEGVREIVFIAGKEGNLMYIELIWGEEGLRGVERKILQNKKV